MKTYNIAAVSYYNTLPFIYGIEHSGYLNNYTLSLDVPSQCAKKLASGQVDLGLIPVGSFPDFDKYHIVSNLCIGAESAVNSVLLLSNSPINDISRIFLDTDSRTSVNLVKILALNHWNIKPEYISTRAYSQYPLNAHEGIVLIGDKTFGLEGKYNYSYDLALEWIRFTGKPFVFAAWISSKPLDESFQSSFEKALHYGVEHLSEVVQKFNPISISAEELNSYLSNNISFPLSENKLQGMNLFLDFLKKLK